MSKDSFYAPAFFEPIGSVVLGDGRGVCSNRILVVKRSPPVETFWSDNRDGVKPGGQRRINFRREAHVELVTCLCSSRRRVVEQLPCKKRASLLRKTFLSCNLLGTFLRFHKHFALVHATVLQTPAEIGVMTGVSNRGQRSNLSYLALRKVCYELVICLHGVTSVQVVSHAECQTAGQRSNS